MAFHEGVWIVVGAAAPIIGLAAVVSMTDLVKDTVAGAATAHQGLKDAIFDAAKWNELFGDIDNRVGSARLWTIIQLVNLGVQAVLLGLSISCLSWRENFLWPWFAAGIEFLSLLVIGGAALRLQFIQAALRTVARQGERTDRA